MRKKLFLLCFALVAAVWVGGCSRDDNKLALLPETLNPTPVLGTVISSPTTSPGTSFSQTIVSHDTGTWNGSYDLFPGQPNVWDISSDFSLSDGNDDQFDDAVVLTVGATGFPSDQTYGELTFYSPTASVAEGVKTAAVTDGIDLNISALTGTYSAVLAPTPDSRLQQTVDLSTGTTGTILLFWNDNANIFDGNLPGYTSQYRVVVRDLAGNELEELYATTTGALSSQNKFLTAYAGQRIVISFEMHTMPDAWNYNGAIIDDVSVKDNNGAGVERITNGTFETGNMTGWTTNAPVVVQNMTSGVRTLEGLNVTRSFYTVPNKLWGRWVDVFENPDLVSAATRTITYSTNLGNDWCGVVYDTPGTNGKAITSWDTTFNDRDVAWAFGLVSSKTYTSQTVLSPNWSVPCDGNDDVIVTKVITVPAGGKMALVNFIVMGSYDTGLTATSVNDRATEVDQEASRIVTNFWLDGQYRTGMTQEQIDLIENF